MVVLMIDGHGESQHQPTVQLTQQWQNAPAPGLLKAKQPELYPGSSRRTWHARHVQRQDPT
jgi:hypothetical protein